jgi:hypothetical protein
MDHETPWPAGSLFAAALICNVLPAWTDAVVGVIETVTARTVTVTVADLELLATEVALIVTFRSAAGGVVGAV